MNISSNLFLYINIFIAILYLFLIIIGYKKGFIYELVSLAYTAISVMISWFLAPVLGKLYPIVKLSNTNIEAQLVSKFVNIDAILNTILYFIIVFVILRIFYIVLSFLLKGMNKIPVIGKFNQILGGLMGIVNATIISLVLSFLLSLPVFKNGEEVRKNTVFKYITKYSDKLVTYAVDNLNLDNIDNYFDNFDIDTARDDFSDWLENR